MASMFDRREKYAQNVGKYKFASTSTYQDNMKFSISMGYGCNAAGGSCDGSAQSRSDRMSVDHGSFHGGATRPVTRGNFGLATTRSNDSTRANGFGAAGIDYNDTRHNPSIERYPSPVRHSTSRKRGLVSHSQRPELDPEFQSKTPFCDQTFPSFSRF